MNRKKIILFLLFNGLIKLFAQQQLDVVHYTTSNGLSNSCIYGIYQDKKGFLWISTEFGLNKFDGNSFNSYDISNGFIENITLSCTDGPNNSLFVGTFSKGLIQIQENGTIKKIVDPFKRGQLFNVFYKDSILYAYSRSNVYSYDYKSKNHKYFNSANDSDSLVYAVSEFGSKLLLGTKDGLYIFSNEKIEKVKSNIVLKNISSIHKDNIGNIWVGAKGVIYKLNAFDFLATDSVVFDNKRENLVDCIVLDDKQDLWFSTILPISLNKVTKKSAYKTFENMSDLLNIGSTDINALLMDREKNVWIATYNKGLYCVKNTFLYTNTYLKNKYIHSIFIDKNSNIYTGCVEGINIFDPKNNEWTKLSANKNEREYTYGYAEHNESIYFLTNGKYPEFYTYKYNNRNMVKISARAMLFVNDSTALSGGWINKVDIRKKINDKFEPVNSIQLEKTNNLNNRVNDIVIDKSGAIWCASDLGIFKIDINKQQSEKVNITQGISKINDIVVDKNNVVWFGTEKSIIKFDQKNWHQYSTLNEQKLGVVNSLAVDKKNRLYVGTLKGLYIIENGISNYLDDKSGLSSNEINELIYDSLNNKLLIATNDSYSEFYVNQYEKFKSQSLSINITSAFINDSLIPLRNEYQLDYEQNNIRLNFVAINLTFPRSVRYQYRIDNGSWLNLSSNVLELASLVHGKHNVNIRASLDNKNWCAYETVFITVSTPFYLTLRFWLIVIISFMLISFFIIQLRINLIQKKANERYFIQKQLEELKFKSLNATINPHFIFNSLNSIQNYINHNDKNKASNYLGKFARLIRLVLDKANEKEITIKEEVERLTYYIQLEQDRFGDNFTFKINAPKQVYDIIIPNMIIQPIVENSILHGIKNIKNAHIEISFEKLRDMLTITIDDNGIGINAALKEVSSTHKSMAISNIKERLALYPNSSLVIKDKKTMNISGTGTLAQIKLQL